MTILHIDSSIQGESSITRKLTRAIADHLSAPGQEVIYRDLDAQPVPGLNGETGGREGTQGQAALEDFLAADTIIVGAPMYNFSIPSALKAWIDRIAIPGKTFRYGANGPEGLAGAKRIVVASSRGGIYGNGPSDFQENYLRQVFSFLGVKQIEVIRAEGVAYSAKHRDEALDQALDQVRQLPSTVPQEGYEVLG